MDEHIDFLGKKVKSRSLLKFLNVKKVFFSTKHLVTTYETFMQPILRYSVLADTSTKKKKIDTFRSRVEALVENYLQST